MASTISSQLQILSLRRGHNFVSTLSTTCNARTPKSASPLLTAAIPNRRQLLFLSTAMTALTARELSANAQDIPLFGIRKKLAKVEEEVKEIVNEGIETAEKGFETAEKGIESAEEEIETAVSFGGLAQAGLVAGAEFVGVLVATSIVNGILGPEAQSS